MPSSRRSTRSFDGNGRVGQPLISFLLCEKHVLDKPVPYLSHCFRCYRQRHYDHLQAVRDAGAFGAWLEFFLAGVLETSLEASATARRIPAVCEQHRVLIADRRAGLPVMDIAWWSACLHPRLSR